MSGGGTHGADAIGTEELRRRIAAALPDLRRIRHDLHAHPELGYEEHRTAGVIQRELGALGVEFVGGLAGGTGVVAHLPPTDPKNAGRPAVALRADIDALPVEERTGLPYASTTQGRMHACGHDGHTAMLLGVARVLKQLPERPNPVTLLFQPAEEGGGGAERLCRDGALAGRVLGPEAGRVFGLHGWPELPVGVVATRPGPLLASTDELRVVIRGTQSHAAYPHYSADPVVGAAHVIAALQTVASRNAAPTDAVVVSICVVRGGSAHNVIPESVEMIGTVRTLSDSTRAMARRRVHEICTQTAAALGCRAEVELNEGYPVTRNDPVLTERFFEVARRSLGPQRVGVIEQPTMGGEDFAYYGRHAPAVFFCLGLRPAERDRYPTLHQPDFDFNDDAMPTGIEVFCRLALDPVA